MGAKERKMEGIRDIPEVKFSISTGMATSMNNSLAFW